MPKRLFLFLLFSLMMPSVFAQGELDMQEKVFYRNEWTIGPVINSNGWGASYRYGKRIDAFKKRLWEVELLYIKHPKEYRSVSMVEDDAKYVYGKKNVPIDLRVSYGRQIELFRKFDLGGISVRYMYNFGPSLAFLKPIYYYVGDPDVVTYPNGQSVSMITPRDKPAIYDPTWEDNNVYIISRASFFRGFSKLKLNPGAFVKTGFSFEFSKNDKIIHALEAGLFFEAFLKKVDILDFSRPSLSQTKFADNQQFYLACYLTYRFGYIIDQYAIKRKKQRATEISY